jgi:hypothetical protein
LGLWIWESTAEMDACTALPGVSNGSVSPRHLSANSFFAEKVVWLYDVKEIGSTCTSGVD